ncbi:MAG: hypothetical protein JWN96_4179, partial [Mycobacterium sp.]|nr:hypothetical protein [Mycobacterium sp.]
MTRLLLSCSSFERSAASDAAAALGKLTRLVCQRLDRAA